jgi:hypothetical protein
VRMAGGATDLEIRSPVGDALLLVDEAALSTLDHELHRSLAIVLDPEGKTDITEDFGAEPWEDVWKREGHQIWALCRAGRLVINLLDRGDFHIRIFDSPLREAGVQIGGSAAIGRLVVTGSTIGIVSAIDWMRRRSLGPAARSYRCIPMPAGDYVVEIGHTVPAPGRLSEDATYWGPGYPAIVAGLRAGVPERLTTNVFRTRAQDLVRER